MRPTEKFPKEQYLVVNAVLPIGFIVAARAFGIIVVNLFVQQFMVKVAVDIQEEVAGSAIEDQGQFSIAEAVCGMDHCIILPVVPAADAVSQVFF